MTSTSERVEFDADLTRQDAAQLASLLRELHPKLEQLRAHLGDEMAAGLTIADVIYLSTTGLSVALDDLAADDLGGTVIELPAAVFEMAAVFDAYEKALEAGADATRMRQVLDRLSDQHEQTTTTAQEV